MKKIYIVIIYSAPEFNSFKMYLSGAIFKLYEKKRLRDHIFKTMLGTEPLVRQFQSQAGFCYHAK